VLGYQVEFTTSPAAALEMVRNKPLHFALVITDQTMPGMTGMVLAGQLAKIQPGLPIIMMTGYGAALMSEKLKEVGIRQLLLKPITIKALEAAVHAVLSAAPAL